MMARSGLRLKAELIAKTVEPPIGVNFLAKVWVDSGVFHLDGEFSYLIPGNLNEEIEVGTFVDVPFNGRILPALVIAREEWAGEANLKSISRVHGRFPLLNEQQISLIRKLSARYISHPFDLIRSMVPTRIASIEKSRSLVFASVNRAHHETESRKQNSSYLQLPPHRDRDSLIATKLIDLVKTGSTLAIFPDLRAVDAIAKELSIHGIRYSRYDSSQSRSEHFSTYLDCLLGEMKLVIGTRSAVFLPLHGLSHLVIYNEGSEHFYEKRSPGWNARDIALERCKSEKISLTFIGYSPSLEICRLIDDQKLTFRKSSARTDVKEYGQVYGELLPSGALQVAKKALKLGPVLFVTPSKGWAHAIRCARCKTLSKCKCGGNFEIASEKSPITCNHCQQIAHNWKCTWCDNPTFGLVGRGMERHAHEIGKLLPGHRIISTNSEAPLLDVVKEGVIVATAGMAPKAIHGYAAIVFLEGNRILNAPDLRAQERMRELFFSHVGLLQEKAPAILIQDEGNPIVTALRLWNPFPILERELAERRDLQLPPFTHTIELTMPKEEIIRFKGALLKAQSEDRLPGDMKILGPIAKAEKSSIVLLADPEKSDSVNRLIHEFMRRRSLTKKPLPSLRIDPYSLSR